MGEREREREREREQHTVRLMPTIATAHQLPRRWLLVSPHPAPSPPGRRPRWPVGPPLRGAAGLPSPHTPSCPVTFSPHSTPHELPVHHTYNTCVYVWMCMYICGYTAHDRYIQMCLALFPGSPSFCAIIPHMMFAPLFFGVGQTSYMKLLRGRRESLGRRLYTVVSTLCIYTVYLHCENIRVNHLNHNMI